VFEKSKKVDDQPSEDSQSPWEKFTLALVEPNASNWFQDYGVVSAPDFIQRETGNNSEVISMLSHIPRMEMGLVPSFEVNEDAIGEIQDIPTSELGEAILSFLAERQVSMAYKNLWPINHESQIEVDVQHRLEGQWGTVRRTPFIQSLEIHRDSKGKLTAYWFVDLLVSPVDMETYNIFELQDDDGSVKSYNLNDSEVWTVGQISTKLHIPVFIKQLAYMCETPFPSTQIMSMSRDIAFSNVPDSARPKPFYSIRRTALAQGYSQTLSGDSGNFLYDGSLYPQVVQFGWRIGEESIPYLENILPTVIDGLSFAMSIVEYGFDNYRDAEFPAPWDNVLGSPCVHLVDYEHGGSRRSAPQWIPNTQIGDITTRTKEIYAELSDLRLDGEIEEAHAKLALLLNDGAGPYFVHAINTAIYSFMLPHVLEGEQDLGDIEYFAQQAIEQNMYQQSTNAMSNLAIAYYLAGDLESSERWFNQALDRPDEFAESEASYFLALIADLNGDSAKAAKYRKRCEAAGGYEGPDWLKTPNKTSKPSAARSAFCGNCGTKFADESQNFCSSCGQPRA
jgi:hypothetical protein